MLRRAGIVGHYAICAMPLPISGVRRRAARTRERARKRAHRNDADNRASAAA